MKQTVDIGEVKSIAVTFNDTETNKSRIKKYLEKLGAEDTSSLKGPTEFDAKDLVITLEELQDQLKVDFPEADVSFEEGSVDESDGEVIFNDIVVYDYEHLSIDFN